MEPLPLAGRTIAVPETREVEVFAALLEKRGATVLRCPLVAIRDAPDPQPVLAWARAFAAGSCDDLILLTGEGLRRLLSCIEAHEPQLGEPFVSALGKVRTITRGPKPARALRELGLRPQITAVEPTTAGVIKSLQQEGALAGRRVGVQLYGSEPNHALAEFLQESGCQVLPVAPYVYADAAEDAAVLALLSRLEAGQVDAIAFTSSPQVQRLFSLGAPSTVLAALSRTVVAAVGPIVAEALAARGVPARVMPEDAFFLKPLTTQLEEALGPKGG
jgi:uroporphyrinogen-III synthase